LRVIEAAAGDMALTPRDPFHWQCRTTRRAADLNCGRSLLGPTMVTSDATTRASLGSHRLARPLWNCVVSRELPQIHVEPLTIQTASIQRERYYDQDACAQRDDARRHNASVAGY
jgi:hypothetical protein